MGGARSTSAPTHQFAWVLAATLAVVGLPMALVSGLRASGFLTSTPLLVCVGMVASISASQLGAAMWASSKHAGDTVFGDLMLWGWLRRRRSERHIASASALFAPHTTPKGAGGDAVDVRRRQRMLQHLATTLEARDPATQGHSRRVARHAAAIAKRMGLPADEVAKIRAGAALHDVGKISTPVSLLNKPGRLTADEFAVIQQHPVVGAEAVASLEDDDLVGIVRHHHERIDGRGYPDGIRGDDIPIGARIVAVADTFDAVTSPRPYRSAKRHRDALAVLDAVAGTQLDREAVRAFRGYYTGLRALAFWAFALNGPRQAIASMFDQAKLGGLQVTGAATAATVATVVAGGVALHNPSVTPPAGGTAPAAAATVMPGADLAVSAGRATPQAKSPDGKASKAHQGKLGSGSAVAARGPSSSQGRGRGQNGSGANSGSSASSTDSGSPKASENASPSGLAHSENGSSKPHGHAAQPVRRTVRSTSRSVHSAAATAHRTVKPAAKTVGSATSQLHAAVPETPSVDTVTVPDQAQAVGLEAKAVTKNLTK